MRCYDLNTPAGKRVWENCLQRRTGGADPLLVRRDALTRRVFGRPVSARAAAAIIAEAIRRQGDAALVKYVGALDGIRVKQAADLKLSAAQRKTLCRNVPAALRKALQQTAGHIREFHRSQMPSRAGRVQRQGVRVTERRMPLDRVGVYVPGGVAPLVSTVLMTVLPAKVAGVREIIMATPAGPNREILPALAYAAELAGVDAIYRMGGAPAIAAMAYGTKTIPKVDKVVGPANVFGTEAKRAVVGDVGIDSLAGPSEILVVADESADPQVVAWDLLAQVEHGAGAVSLLITSSPALAEAVALQLEQIVRRQPEYRTMMQGITLFRVNRAADAEVYADAYAPEHLSLQVRHPRQVLKRIHRAGAAFLGGITAQAMGDYAAGPNHVLPTRGTAAWASPLSVRDFERFTSVVEYTPAGMQHEAPAAIRVAEAEGLAAHAQSLRQRTARSRA